MAKDLLDLLGFKADQVEEAIDRFLVQISNSNLKKARIMTVKAIAIKYLKLAGYQWSYEKLTNGKNNEGCLVLFLE